MIVKIQQNYKYWLLNKQKRLLRLNSRSNINLILNKKKDSIFRERIESEEGLNQSPSATIKTRL